MLALVVALLGLVGLVVSVRAMALRLAEFNDRTQRTVFVFRPVESRDFVVHGHPVALRDEDDPKAGWMMAITYGETSLRLPVTIPGDRRLPGLLPHQDWFRVLRFAPLTGMSMSELQTKLDQGAVQERIAIVTRTPPPGADPRTWGQVWRKQWVFNFYEFLPDGTFRHERLRYPTNRGQQPAKEGELKPNTWEYQAALMVMPVGSTPSIKQADSNLRAAGWTLPGAVASTFALVGGLVVSGAVRAGRATSAIGRSTSAARPG